MFAGPPPGPAETDTGRADAPSCHDYREPHPTAGWALDQALSCCRALHRPAPPGPQVTPETCLRAHGKLPGSCSCDLGVLSALIHTLYEFQTKNQIENQGEKGGAKQASQSLDREGCPAPARSWGCLEARWGVTGTGGPHPWVLGGPGFWLSPQPHSTLTGVGAARRGRTLQTGSPGHCRPLLKPPRGGTSGP